MQNQFVRLDTSDYKFHDAVVEQFQFDATRGRLLLVLWNKDSRNENITRIQLIISGIINREDVDKIQSQINYILLEQKRKFLNYRIDEFNFRKNSDSNNLHLRLVIDNFIPVVINCQKITWKILN